VTPSRAENSLTQQAGSHRPRGRVRQSREAPAARLAEIPKSREVDAELTRDASQSLSAVAYGALELPRTSSGSPPQHAKRRPLPPRLRADLTRPFLSHQVVRRTPVLFDDALEGRATLVVLSPLPRGFGFDRLEGERSVAARESL